MEFLQSVYGLVWGAPALALILSFGLFLSAKTGFLQIRLLPRALGQFFRRMFGNNGKEGGVSSFQAVCTALAATVGTGNLAGVAGAISLGGPGAIFWMWLCGLLGMIIKCAEATLAVRYRVKDVSGEYIGGPMFMIRQGLPSRFWPLAWVYAMLGVIAAFGVGNATQINTVIRALEATAHSYGCFLTDSTKLWIGIALAGLVGLALLGGAKRIGAVTELLIPFAAGLYLLLAVFVLLLRLEAVPQAFAAIFRGAFAPGAVTGGVIGSMLTGLRTGISRGVFTNEAGMGTASMAHAGANVSHPAQQGLMGIVEVFLDTIVICTMTALVILCSGVAVPYGMDAGIGLTNDAFSLVLGPWVGLVLTVALCLFAVATVLGWGLYGIRCATFLFGSRAWRFFALLQTAVVVIGATLPSETLWLVAEILNGLMTVPNIVSLWALSPQFLKIYESYQHGGTYEDLYQCQSL